MAEKNPERISIPLCTQTNGVPDFILSRVLNLKRIMISMLFAIALDATILTLGRGGEATAPLAIFASLISLLFVVLFFYVLSIKPKVQAQIKAEEGKSGHCIFCRNDFSVCFDGQDKRTLSYNDIRGQYWFGDYYMIHIDCKNYRTILTFLVSRNTFDDIYMLANALTRRKTKLIQITPRKQTIEESVK